MMTKTYMDPCCANQNPSLNPPINILSRYSLNKIEKQNDTRNQTDKSIATYFRF